jgi:hypothetical protein
MSKMHIYLPRSLLAPTNHPDPPTYPSRQIILRLKNRKLFANYNQVNQLSKIFALNIEGMILNAINDDTPHEYLDLLFTPSVDTTSWSGDNINTFAGLLYLLRKYPNTCVSMDVYEFEKRRGIHMMGRPYFMRWICENPEGLGELDPRKTPDPEPNSRMKKCKRKLIYPDNFVEKFEKCKDKPHVRYIIGFIAINHYYPPSGHINAFLYDKKDNSIEVFEPHGSRKASKFDSEEYANGLRSFFKTLGIKDKDIYIDNEFCPLVSFQSIQTEEIDKDESELLETDPYGFCQAWVIWWIDYRLANQKSKLSRKQLVDHAIKTLKEHPDSFNKFIRNYSEFVIEHRNILLYHIFDRMEKSEEGLTLIRQLVEFDKADNRLKSRLRKAISLNKAEEIEFLEDASKELYKHRPDDGLLILYLIQELQREITNK